MNNKLNFFKEKYPPHKNNYDVDSSENNQILSNLLPNKNRDKNEDLNCFQNIKIEENEINRISNLKDNELTLEDKLQIQKQINDDNDNEMEVIENILNNFGKEKNNNKFNNKFNNGFMMYKNRKKNKFKSNSVINRNNKILNKIKNDIALINFQQEINKIHKLHNYHIFLKSERAHLNIVKKNNIIQEKNLNQINNNKKRIEEIKKKLLNKNNNSYKQTDIKKLINTFNKNRKKENLTNSNNEKAFKQILEEITNFKEAKISNYNEKYDYLCETFRSQKNINKNENQLILSENNNNNKENKNNKNFDDNGDYLKTEESSKINSQNSNQFFYTVFKNSIKKYPYLHILKNKINKMQNSDVHLLKNSLKERNKNKNGNNLSILEKINKQTNIFQKEIEKYNSKF
jgi:hypothetical protein